MSCEVGGKHLKYAIAFTLLVAALVVLCILFFKSMGEEDEEYAISGIYNHAAVSTDAAQCAKIGLDIMERLNGNAVDSVVATLFCMGLVIPESLGLGGGCFITLYNATTRSYEVIDGREVAPRYSYDGMFGDADAARYGVQSIAIPGELQAYHTLHSKYGSLPWAQLLEPSIRLAYEGFSVGGHLANAIAEKWKLFNDTHLRSVLTDPTTDMPYALGGRMKRHDLAETFKTISKEGVDAMYSHNGSTVLDLIKDLQGKGSQLRVDDIVNYKTNQYTPYPYRLANGHTLYSIDPPGSGLVLAFIVDIVLRSFQSQKLPLTTQQDSNLYYARLIEAFKYGYAIRSYLGDPKFDDVSETINFLKDPKFRVKIVSNILTMTRTSDDIPSYFPEPLVAKANGDIAHDRGTSAVTVVDPSGSAVAVCTSVNQYFGSFIISQSTGIILNDQMDDFAGNFTNQYGINTTTPYNRIERGKRPVSSMAPAIITNDQTGQVVLALGASGGAKITASLANIILKTFLFDSPLDKLIDEPRIHHQLIPNLVEYEDGFNGETLDHLKSLGHVIKKLNGRSSIVMAIHRAPNGVYRAATDPRKMGAVDGF